MACRNRWAGAALDAGRTQVFLHQVSQAVLAEGLAELVQEQHPGIRLQHQLGPHLFEVAPDPVDGPRAERHIPILASLALAHRERAVLQIHIVESELDQLGAADAARVQRFQDGPVAQRFGVEVPLIIRALRERHHLLDLLAREDVRGQASMHARQLQLGSRIAQDVVLAREPLEEHPQRDQPLHLRGKGERLAVVLAVVIQEAPVALQDRPGDLLGRADGALLSPADKAP